MRNGCDGGQMGSSCVPGSVDDSSGVSSCYHGVSSAASPSRPPHNKTKTVLGGGARQDNASGCGQAAHLGSPYTVRSQAEYGRGSGREV